MENVLALGDPQIDIAVKVDHGLQIVHVLDLNQGGRSLTNGIGDHQAAIFRKMSIIGNVNDWMWIMYPSDGITYVFGGNPRFLHIPLDDSRLYLPYVEIMKERRAALL